MKPEMKMAIEELKISSSTAILPSSTLGPDLFSSDNRNKLIVCMLPVTENSLI